MEKRDNLSEHLKCIVQYTGEVKVPGVLSWSDLLEIGRAQEDEILQQRLEKQAVNLACMLVYTSGTTGDHFNLYITDLRQGLVKGAKLCLNPYFFGWLEK